MACFCSAELVLRHGLLGRKTVCCRGGMLKDTTVGLLMLKLFATCWGMLFQVFRLAYLNVGQVHLGLVSGVAVHVSLF